MPSPDEPLVVAGRDGSRRLVVAADRAARTQGVQPGVTVAFAQAVVPGLGVAEADPKGDAAALERLAAWALRYTPLVAADSPDGLVLDIAGAAHLWASPEDIGSQSGEEGLLADLSARLARAGIAAQAAVAGGWAAAWGLARYRPGTVTEPGNDTEALAPLSVAALRLDPALVTTLRTLGLDTVGDLLAAPRPSLALRFGPALTRRLDAVQGGLDEPIEPVLVPALPRAGLVFAEPLGHANGLAIALRRLAATLCDDLETRGLGARRLDLRLARVDGAVAALRVGAARATRDPAHIARLFGDRLGTVDPGFGIEAAVLVAGLTETLGPRQASLAPGDAEADLAPLIDRIAGRIGEARIYRLAPVESDVPERSLRRVPALAPPAGLNWHAGPRPQRLFDPPQPVEVVALLPDRPPALVTWNGRRHRIACADGPESIAGEWWLPEIRGGEAEVRDYFRVETEEGQRLWLMRLQGEGPMRWFVQGVFA